MNLHGTLLLFHRGAWAFEPLFLDFYWYKKRTRNTHIYPYHDRGWASCCSSPCAEDRARAGFADREARLHRGWREHYGDVELTEIPAPTEISQALHRYFAGEPEALDTLPAETAGSELQRRVWAALRRIPAGTTATYGKLAKPSLKRAGVPCFPDSDGYVADQAG